MLRDYAINLKNLAFLYGKPDFLISNPLAQEGHLLVV